MAARLDRVGVSRVVQAPILGGTFMLGPLGCLVAVLTEFGLRIHKIPGQLARLKGDEHVRV